MMARSRFQPEQVDWCELRGPTDCSVYDRAKWEALLARLGPDPLGEDPRGHDDPQRYVDAVRKSKKPIAELLMDQAVLVGSGEYLPGGDPVSAPGQPFHAG